MAKILLVDGDQARLEAARRALAGPDYEVVVAPSSSFALTMLEWDPPDLVISQAEVPGIDGYELCSIIRSDPKTKDLPFLLLTDSKGPISGAATRAGVDMVLAGRTKLADIVGSIRGLL